ncbi:MAG: MerR family transcriptional regulator, partial [Clostridia bacterium]|nr:MerR family transcriptional regulator [Clostridia bacterium]
MSKYTTGEIAKLCGVSVRTVQYYDTRGILVPGELSEGGRRLYTEADLKRLRIICFLREAGLPINSIAALFAEEKPESIISVLLDEQEKSLREELAECRAKLGLIEGIRSELKEIENFSVESIGDIAHAMKQKNKLKRMRWIMVLSGLPVSALQCTA